MLSCTTSRWVWISLVAGVMPTLGCGAASCPPANAPTASAHETPTTTTRPTRTRGAHLAKSRARIEALCQQAAEQGKLGAFRIGLVDGGETWQHSYDTLSNGKPADETTLFEIGSITKTFTALLLADMATRGEVRLDQPMVELLPEKVKVAEELGAITLEQLSTHRSGLPVSWPGYTETNPRDPFDHYTLEVLYTGLAQVRLATPPGTAYAYNNHAVALLGHLLAQRLGVDYAQAIAQRVVAPLGLHDVFLGELPASERGRLAEGHDEQGKAQGNWSFGAIAPAGSLRTTLPSMLDYADALLTQRGALGPALELAARARDAGPTPNVSTGLGFHLLEAGRVLFHNGQASQHAFLAVDRAHDVGVVILTDRRGMGADALGMQILQTLRGDVEPVTPKAPAPTVELDARQRAALVGSYRLSPNFVIVVHDKDGKLSAQATGQQANPLEAESPTLLRIPGTEIRLQFEMSSKVMRARKLVLLQDGRETPGVRE